MSTTPKQHIAKMIDAMVKGNDAEVEANFKSAVVPKTAAFFGLTSDEGAADSEGRASEVDTLPGGPDLDDPEVTEED